MTAPTILAESWTTPSGSNATTYVITVPTGSAGDVVECLVGSTSNANLSVSSGSGWKLVQQWKHASGLSEALFRKKLGTSGADSLTVASATSCRFNAHTVRLPVGTRTYASYAGATATSTNSNPPLVDHKKSRDTLYTAYRAGSGTVVPSAGPSGYGTRVNNAATSGGVSLTYAYKTATSSSDDPGTFTSSSALWGCVTIARWIDTTGPLLSAFKALCYTSPSTPLIVGAYGTSFTAGTKNDGTGVDTLGGNMVNGARPAIWAAGFTALPAKHFLIGTSGLVTPTNTAMNAADNRFSADSSFSATDSFAFFLEGRAGWGLTTAAHKATYTLGVAFDRVRVRYYSDPSLSTYTIDVDGGTPQNINLSQSAAYREQTFNLTGTSSSVIHINSPGGASTILGVEVWTSTVPQVSFFNVGWSSGNSNDFVANIAGNAALGAKLTILETYLNDSVAGISNEQSLENNRLLALTGLATGEVMFSAFPYVGAGAEATEDALQAPYLELADTLGCAWFDVRTLGSFTSQSAEVAAGYFGAGSNHPKAAGYAAWGGYEVAYFDPGPPAVAVTPNNAAHAHSATSPTLAQKSTVTANNGAHAHTSTSPSLATNTTAAPNDASHAQSATSPTIAAGAASVTPADAAHGHSVGSPALATNTTVAPNDAAHGQSATSPTVAVGGAASVAPNNAAHGHTATSPSLAAASSVTPANAAHAHTASSPTLAAASTASPANATHGQTASSPTLAFATTVTASSATHAHTATSPALAANDNAVHPANATHYHWATSPVLVSTPLEVPGYTDPLSIEGGGSVVKGSINGGGSVVAGSITSTGRVVAGSLRGRP